MVQVWGSERMPVPELHRAIPIRTAWDQSRMNEAWRATVIQKRIWRIIIQQLGFNMFLGYNLGYHYPITWVL